MELQPVNDEFCWCCLRGNLPNNRLYRCVKCGLYCHLQCCDPIILEALNDSEEKEFVCFKCQKCRGCGTEVCFYGKWEHVLVDNEKVTCCEECQENYREGLYCNVCLKTMDNEELKEKCLKCEECGEWVHRECDNKHNNTGGSGSGSGNSNKNRKRENDRRQRRREDSVFEDGIESRGSEEESVEEDNNNSGLLNSNVGMDTAKEETTKVYRCPKCRRKEMMEVLLKLKELDSRGIFLSRITEEIAPHYFDMISREDMVCFDLMEDRIRRKQYSKSQEFRDDFERMCYNAFVYNMYGDEVWKCTSDLFEKGEKVLNEYLSGSVAGDYCTKINQIKTSKEKPLTRPEPSNSAKQACRKASKIVEIFDIYRVNEKQLRPLSPLAGPYSNSLIPPVVEYILPQYASMIAMDCCLSCGSTGDRDRMLFCGDCGECYHVYCVNANGTANHEMKCGWRCPNCKICEVCGLSVNAMKEMDKICSCNRCDRSFHKSCLNYVDDNNLNLFVCGYCFNCKKCGLKGSPTSWSYHRDYCRNCYTKEERFRRCAVCDNPWNASDVDMAFCDGCEQWIHHRCVMNDMIEWLKSEITRNPYHCIRCRQSNQTKSNLMNPICSNSNSNSNSSRSPNTIENDKSNEEEEGEGERETTISRLISDIQEKRQELRLKELLPLNESNRSKLENQLEPYWCDMVRTIVRVCYCSNELIDRQTVYYSKLCQTKCI